MIEAGPLRRCCCALVLSTLCVSSQASAQISSSAQSPQSTGLTSPRTRGVIFGDVVSETVGDFMRLPSSDTLKLLSIGAALAMAGHTVDAETSSGLATSPRFDRILGAGESIGSARLQAAGAVATYLVGRVAKNERVSAVGGDLIRAQIVAQTLTGAVKYGVKRGRPDGTEFSFPSGHSSVTFASATVIQRHYGWKAGIPAYAVAGYVATSRIQDRRHFLSDVVFGAAVGIVAGRTVTVGAGEHRFAVAPMVTRGGGGISMSLVGNK